MPEEHDEDEEECLFVSDAELEDFPLSLLLVTTFLGEFDLVRKNLAIFRLALLLLGDFPLMSDTWMGITIGDRDWGGGLLGTSFDEGLL